MDKTSAKNNEPMLNKQIMYVFLLCNRSEEKVIQHSKSYDLFAFGGEGVIHELVVEKKRPKKARKKSMF